MATAQTTLELGEELWRSCEYTRPGLVARSGRGAGGGASLPGCASRVGRVVGRMQGHGHLDETEGSGWRTRSCTPCGLSDDRCFVLLSTLVSSFLRC